MNERLKEMRIRELRFDDLQTRVQWMNDPKVYSSMHFDLPVLMDNTISWYERIKNNESRSDVVFIEDERIVAFGGLTSKTEDTKKAELYIFVSPDSQHSGLGTAATLLLCEWGFTKLGLNKIYLYTNEDNLAAIRVYEKCGFVLEGRLRQEFLTAKGELKDRLYFGLLNSDYVRSKTL